MSEPINREDIRVGDIIRAVYEYYSHKETYEGTISSTKLGTLTIEGAGTVYSATRFELIERPERKFKVGDGYY